MSKNAFSKTNQLKAIAGAAFTKFIEEELDILFEKKIIKGLRKKQNFKHPGYAYEKQYLADFIIETLDDKFIVVRSTTSYRQDRIKTSFYDLQGINQHAAFASNIIASVFVVPDSEIKIESLKKRIEEKKQYSPASHILNLSEFITFLEGYQYEIETKREEQKAAKTAKEKGSIFGKRGNSFEKAIVEILSDYNNLKQCKNGQLENTHIYNQIISRILKDRQIVITKIVKIKATNAVPLLKNGGNPKTDIIVYIETDADEIFKETLSLKNTTKDRVSCHDYTAKAFIEVLKCSNTKLAKYLSYFQDFPTYTAFKENIPTGYSESEFSELLEKSQLMLIQWALRGMHDHKNLTRPKVQISNYLLISNGDKTVFYSMKDYIRIMLKNTKLKFGVPFSWTYPSKQRGKRIQLKVPIFFSKK